MSEWQQLAKSIKDIRGSTEQIPDASIVIPVNAQADLHRVLTILDDIGAYRGPHTLEIILVINNYQADNPPAELERFEQSAIKVVAVPSARKPGEVVIVSARALGVKAASSEITIHLDADCRICNSNALLDWYINTLQGNTMLAYSRVDFYALPDRTATRIRTSVHHTARWIKRTLLGIPTTRGSNYAVKRALFLQLYETGQLAVDMQIGPLAKLHGAEISYSGDPARRVLTSARKHSGRWWRLVPYFFYRLSYNFHALPTSRHQQARKQWDGYDRETERRLGTDMAVQSLSSTEMNDER